MRLSFYCITRLLSPHGLRLTSRCSSSYMVLNRWYKPSSAWKLVHNPEDAHPKQSMKPQGELYAQAVRRECATEVSLFEMKYSGISDVSIHVLQDHGWRSRMLENADPRYPIFLVSITTSQTHQYLALWALIP